LAIGRIGDYRPGVYPEGRSGRSEKLMIWGGKAPCGSRGKASGQGEAEADDILAIYTHILLIIESN